MCVCVYVCAYAGVLSGELVKCDVEVCPVSSTDDDDSDQDEEDWEDEEEWGSP